MGSSIPRIPIRARFSGSAQNAPDARREIFEERGVFCVRRSDEEIEATQQMEYFERNHHILLLIASNMASISALVTNKGGTKRSIFS